MSDEDGLYLAELLRVLSGTETWAARISPAAGRQVPAPRSSLRGDDTRAHPYELSHASWHSLSHAVDHLSCLRALLADAKVIHMYAPFSLLRAALENACAAIWMLQPTRRRDRLTRRLRFAITDIRNGEEVKELTGQHGPRSEQERMQQLRAIAGRAGIDEAAIKRGVGYAEIVKSVDELSGMQVRMIYLCWKLCSGAAHGDFWPTWSGLERVALPGMTGDVGTFRIEMNLKLLVHVTTLAMELTGLGFKLRDQRCTAPL